MKFSAISLLQEKFSEIGGGIDAIILPSREGYVFIADGLSVSKKLLMDFDDIFRKCQKCNEEQLIRFW